MAYYPATAFVPQFFNDAGVPLSGGTLSAFVRDSSTPTNMFIDDAGTSAGAVITLNARGEPTVSGNTVVIWLDSAVTYKFILKDASAVSKWTANDIADAGVMLRADLANTSDAALGDALVGVKRTLADAIATTLHAWMEGQIINVKTDFGATGDGTTNDTAAIQNAIDTAISTRRSLYFPSGTYIAANLTYATGSVQISFIGDGSGNTTLKNNIDTNPVLTLSSVPNQITFRGITFSGNGSVTSWGDGTLAGDDLVGTIPTSGAAIRLVDVVHSIFEDCYFNNAVYGADIQGGIVITFIASSAYYNLAGFRIWKSSGSGYPNVITFRDSHAKENGDVGVYFDQGRLLIMDGCDIEGNGKNTVQATSIACGLYIGSLTGTENGATAGPNSTPFHTFAASVSNCWFEQNGNNTAGVPNSANMAHIVHGHGFLHVKDTNFANSTAGRVIRVNAGQYRIDDCSVESTLTTTNFYVDEGATSGNASLADGNYINNMFGNSPTAAVKLLPANFNVDKTKTYFDFNRYEESKILRGSGTTSSGILTVTFASAFGSAPIVVPSIATNDNTTTTYSAEVYSVTTTGCIIRAKQNAGGVVTQPAITVGWIAAGTGGAYS